MARASEASGAPLPGNLQARFESSLGADLSAVRIHTAAASAEASEAVGARAYAMGNDIHFDAGQYRPDDPSGVHLLAHEVAHTVQQAGAPARVQHKLEVSTPGDASEQAADRAADAMAAGLPAAGLLHGHAPAIQRDANVPTPNPGPPGAPPAPADQAPANQPANEPELAKTHAVWDKDKKQWGFPDVQYKEVKGKAVVGSVSPDDVHQGAVGDCYLMAALISLAATSPATIENAITPDSPGKWNVRLYARQPDGSFKAFTYPVDNMFPTNASGGMAYGQSYQHDTKQISTGRFYVDNTYNDPLFDPTKIPRDAPMKDDLHDVPDMDARELWPAIIEKAYAMHAPALGKKQDGQRAGGYDDIGSGDGSNVAFETLTGKPATSTDMSALGGDQLSAKIRAALAAHQVVTAGTLGGSKTNAKLLNGGNVYANHAYAVMSLTGEQITLRNPWGETYKSDDLEAHPELKAKDNSGIIQMTLEDLRRQFDTIYIGTAATPTS